MSPMAYEKIRDKLISRGHSAKEAKTIAAKIYNAKHPDHPVTGKHKKGK